MFVIVFDFCYYIIFLVLPFVAYFVILKQCDTTLKTKKSWTYYLKYPYAVKAVKNIRNELRSHIESKSDEDIEKCRGIATEQHSDSQAFHGSDQKGNNLSIKITLRADLLAEIHLCLRLSNGNVYVLPGGVEHEVEARALRSQEWRIGGLKVETLEPFRRVRITHNGMMFEENRKKLEHVQFNFVWNSAGRPKFFPQDAKVQLLADAISKEKWRDGSWVNLLKHQFWYQSFGALQGFIRAESFGDLELYLAASRIRKWGLADRYCMDKHLALFLITTDGTAINIGAKSYRKGCSEIHYGNIICSSGDIFAIDECDLRLDHFGTTRTPPKALTVHLKANGKTLKCFVELKSDRIHFENDERRGFDLVNVAVECSVNTKRGTGLLELWQSRKGCKVVQVEPLLREHTLEVPPKILTVDLRSEEGKIVNLTGGKGASLALLKTIDSIEFSVPDGFVVTTYAFNEQLEYKFNIKKALAILEDIAHGKTKGDLQEACKETVEQIKKENVISDLVAEILCQIKKLKQEGDYGWAVRSSAVGEDSEELSAAGQNETILGCQTEEDVIRAVALCWASLYTFQSVQYRRQNGLPVKTTMAVVVQKMVPADTAGVTFTCHPSTNDPSKVLITANYGLGESVVSGQTEPDTIILDKSGDQLTVVNKILGSKSSCIKMDGNVVKPIETDKDESANICLTDEQILRLAKVATSLEKHFGDHRDIEWAFHKDRLFLLQSRPVTTLSPWTDFELLHEFDAPILAEDGVFTRANVGEVLPGATTVLTQSTGITNIDRALQIALFKEYDPYVSRCVPTSHHVTIIDVINSIHKRPSKKIGLFPKIMDLSIFGHEVLDDRINAIAIDRFGLVTPSQKFRDLLKMATTAWNNKSNLKQMLKLSNNVHIDIDKRDTSEDIYRKIDDFLTTHLKMNQLHCKITETSVFYQIIAMSVLAENNNELQTNHFTDIALLLSSCQDVVSAEVPTALEQLAGIIKESGCSESFGHVTPEAGADWLRKNCPKAFGKFEEFLEKHGHRALGEFKLIEDTWADKPAEVIRMIQANCLADRKIEKNVLSIDEVVSKLISPTKNSTRRTLKFIMKRGRVAVGYREQSKSELIRATNKLRIAYRKLATKMSEEGKIPDSALIFHLTHNEIKRLLKAPEPLLIKKAVKRRRLYPKWNQLRFPEIVCGLPKPENDNKDEFLLEGDRAVACKGTPVCAGEVKARACVINSLEEIDQLKAGDILITYSTDIGWSPYFPILSGVVTELGGLVSHGAVVAREYGLPCIVGVKNGTKVFKTGDSIHLSGKSGTLTLIT